MPTKAKRLGLSAPVATIILVVVAVAIAMLVGTLTQAKVGAFARSESIKVIEASAYYQPNGIYVVAKVKNDGSVDVNNVAVSAMFGTSTASVGTIGTLRVGAEGAVSGFVSLSGVGRGDMIVVEATGMAAGTSSPVRHATSVPVV
ncbi:MAG: hypothetical protein B9J98_04115 [Candidatus Terraquivivens tikiterensis]|uniref:Archaeal Type IV pilin N-terminal domain-containing protein n=1 Tax=Candidatus Terraquivivens tikiterensis TaxID=1980982 RepID=A0A2R7Y531_9ARCH|nr:MAG: hypothetical protein B9J98_04115 [Candidatus Terraquivivens tikiterensis]